MILPMITRRAPNVAGSLKVTPTAGSNLSFFRSTATVRASAEATGAAAAAGAGAGDPAGAGAAMDAGWLAMGATSRPVTIAARASRAVGMANILRQAGSAHSNPVAPA